MTSTPLPKTASSIKNKGSPLEKDDGKQVKLGDSTQSYTDGSQDNEENAENNNGNSKE
jgi:hypothetical protein